MATDATKPLAPLDPQLVAHLTVTLGPPKPQTFACGGSRDIVVRGAWTVGSGQTCVGGDPSKAARGTDVEILLTEGGKLVTTRTAWTRTQDGFYQESQTSPRSTIHETPESAYQWLLADGKGKLGPASKAAWVQACRNVPPMAGLEFEHVD